MIVEVFKTNVTDNEVADKIISDLSLIMPESRINFDLTDCDKILRIESTTHIHIESISERISNWGYVCEVLEP
ncbi:hypothetical protein [Cytophaga aurantiaca]|uniref:hypothetical protein n=1 Tax=Cytophaga aurantiaca TaxID=29530 RepID=UPI0003A57983|nr:hypothetical protein [Cytophaga aurantiaca]